MTENKENFDIIDQMTKLVEKKLSEIKFIVPIVLTVVTSVIAFFMVQKVEPDNVNLIKAYLLIIAFLLSCFLLLFLINYPFAYYNSIKKSKENKNNLEFSPWNIKSFLFLTDNDFYNKIKECINTELTSQQNFALHCLKQKVNELRIKLFFLRVVYGIIILGVLLLIYACIAYII